MKQLVKTIEELPSHIKEYIQKDIEKIYLVNPESEKNYCSNCLEELNTNNECLKCHKKYEKNSAKEIYFNLEELKDLYFALNHSLYVFDVMDKKPYLYVITTIIYYHNPFMNGIYKTISTFIQNIFKINRNSCIDLISNQTISYKKFNSIHSIEYTHPNHDIDWMIAMSKDKTIQSVYTENIEILKDTIYQYSCLWDIKERLKNLEYLVLEDLILFPLKYPSFEYLIKMKLYTLALESCNRFDKGKTFKEILGISKNYLSFMQEQDLDETQLDVLKECEIEDIQLINFYSYYSRFIRKAKELHIDYKKVYEYFIEKQIPAYQIIEYSDYVDFLLNLGYELNNQTLFPGNFQEEHNRLYLEVENIERPIINENIKKLSNLLSINQYKTKDYVIYPAPSSEEMIKESQNQHNCLKTYIERYSNNRCQIYFMRKIKELEKSFVTIEVRDNKVVQARLKYNKEPDSKIMNIISTWEKTLIPIETES